MQKIDRYKKSRSALAGARAFLSLIGRPSVNATARHNGSLCGLSVKTRIHYQPSDGAQNYHENKDFDEALSRTIMRNFAHLSALAIEDMIADTKLAAEEASAELEALRAEFSELCTSTPSPSREGS